MYLVKKAERQTDRQTLLYLVKDKQKGRRTGTAVVLSHINYPSFKHTDRQTDSLADSQILLYSVIQTVIHSLNRQPYINIDRQTDTYCTMYTQTDRITEN